MEINRILDLIKKYSQSFIDGLKRIDSIDKANAAVKAKFKNYIPKYWARTEEEHKAIRKRVSRNPDSCNHLKGGVYRHRVQHKDYAVSLHTFIDGTKRIRCLLCGKKWFKDSPDWLEAMKMVEQSSNFPSSTEHIVGLRATVNGEVEYFHNAKDLKDEYPNWDGKIKGNSYEGVIYHGE